MILWVLNGQKSTDFVDNSTFLTNRFGTDSISKKKATQKISDIAGTPMNAIDGFTAESVVRAKYLENLHKGMTEEQALKEADRWAGNLMADRSKGALPVIFNNKSPFMKLVNMFQVEPNNIVSNYTKDMKLDAKSKKQLAYHYGKLMAASYGFNSLIMAIRGGNEVLPDTIRWVGYLMTMFMSDDDDEKEKAKDDLIESLVGSTPFLSNLAGLAGMEDIGRVPISNAMPNFSNISNALDKDNDSKYRMETGIKEVSKLLYYIGLPTGGAQIKKTLEGILATKNGGSYKTTKEGGKQLQFPIDQTAGNYIKSGLFGKYSLNQSKEYTENGFKTLNAEQTKLYEDSGIEYNTLKDYFKYSEDEAKVTDDNKYTKYTDSSGNVYWFDKNTQTMYDANYTKSNKQRKELQKATKDDMLVKYINNLNLNNEQKFELYKYNVISSTVREDGTSEINDVEYMLKNGMTKEKYMNTYKKALENNVSYPNKEEYIKLTKAGLKVDNYIDYKSEVKERTEEKRKSGELDEDGNLKNKDKMQIVLDSKSSDSVKSALYSTYVDKDDDLYNNLLKDTNIDIDEYLNYKIAAANKEFDSDKKDDGTINGESIKGTAKTKLYKYINNMKLTYEQRIMLLGREYKLNNTDQKKLFNYINDKSGQTQKEKLEMFKMYSNNFDIYKNNRVGFK